MAVFLRPSRSVLRIAEGVAAAGVAHQARAPQLPQRSTDKRSPGCVEELEATPLTPAEMRVLRYLPTYLSYDGIAAELFVSAIR